MKNMLITALLLLSGCSTYVPYIEYEHISSIPNGTPFNNRHEIQTDQVFVGSRFDFDSGAYVDVAIGANVGSSELEGRNPWGRFKVGYAFK